MAARNAVALAKKALRKEIAAALAAASDAALEEANADIVAAILRSPEYAAARTVAAYMAMPREVDLAAVIARAFADGKTVALPRVHFEPARRMDMALVPSPEVLASLAPVPPYGIVQPAPDAIAATTIDLVLVPGVAFDTRGGRCGHGAGFYDRFFGELADLHAAAGLPPPTKIGVAFPAQIVDAVPMTATDVALDRVITSSAIG
eukprot:a3327_38.p2 GENE.a3327_38~~a3327_38.p2  ORF type:complete len:215 (-),score=50.75 a3327_38:173-787(-)